MAKRPGSRPASPETAPTVSPQRGLELIKRCHEKGVALLQHRPVDENEYYAWTNTTSEVLLKCFGSASGNVANFNASGAISIPMNAGPSYWEQKRAEGLSYKLKLLESCMEQLQMDLEDASTSPVKDPSTNLASKKIFLGHGRAPEWRTLADFLQNRLRLEWDEFNRESAAGRPTTARLQDMLNNATFAFLIMTAEDEHADATKHARENVIHEIGLFQGKLGFERAIILLEDGCQEFSNIIGLTQIRFPKGQIRASFEDIRLVLERERIL